MNLASLDQRISLHHVHDMAACISMAVQSQSRKRPQFFRTNADRFLRVESSGEMRPGSEAEKLLGDAWRALDASLGGWFGPEAVRPN